MREKLKSIFAQNNILLSDKQIDQFEQYYKFLVEENAKYNLTAITQEDDVVIKHFLDSAIAASMLKQNAKVIDVGSGAGFPGIPLKIVRPDIKITLLDSLQKRVNFLSQCERLLGLTEVTTIHARAEEYTKTNREKFDYAVSRAVAQTSTLLEYLLPYVKVEGKALLYKSSKAEEEIEDAATALSTLGGKVEQVKEYDLYGNMRKIVVVNKNKPTPAKYPRGKNLPKTKPLGK